MRKRKNNSAGREKGAFARHTAAALPRLTLECIEKYELLLCGCKKIECYTPERTVICAHSGKVSVRGKGLCIAFMGEGKIMLSGVIDAIEFL
ncbi:MAG: YabP/YqfC family sporulation protein [Clostridia bacterium]|nr:YabP/YqfC family sporulation protein [Clostridia bacterium]